MQADPAGFPHPGVSHRRGLDYRHTELGKTNLILGQEFPQNPPDRLRFLASLDAFVFRLGNAVFHGLALLELGSFYTLVYGCQLTGRFEELPIRRGLR